MDRFTHRLRVRWNDCDPNGHMANTAYSVFATETRLAFFAASGLPVERILEVGFGPVVFREELDYLREVRLGEEIEVDLQLAAMSPEGAKWRIAHALRREGEPVARVVLAGGWMDLRARRIRSPPPELLGALTAAPRAEPFEALPALGSSRK
jgi:acyl-CoA thioester hydrolase